MGRIGGVWIGGVVELFTFYFAVTAGVLVFVVLPMKIYQAAFGISNALFIAESQKSPFFSTLTQFWYWFIGKELPPVEYVPDDSKGARFTTFPKLSIRQPKACKKTRTLWPSSVV